MKNKPVYILYCFFTLLASPLCAQNEKNYYDLESYITLNETFTINQAIECAINNNSDIQLQKAALLNASGVLLQAKSSFDVKTGGEISYGRNYTPYDSKNLSVISGDEILYQTVNAEDFTTKAYVEKLFSFGINAKLNYQLTRGKQKYQDGIYALDPYYASYGVPNYNNSGSITLEVSVPLLKGFNQAIADNNLKMAQTSYESMAYNLEDTVAKVIMQTSETYWKFYSAYEKVQELEKMVQKNQQRNESFAKLVETGIRNKSELLRIQVNLLNTQRQLETAKIDYMTAKTNLAAQIGIPIEAVSDPELNLPEVKLTGDFPKTEDYTREKLEEIILSRPDMISLANSCDAAALKVQVAKVDARPDLDLSLSIGTNGTKYGWGADKYFGATFSNIRGLNYSGKLTFSMPLPNNQKKGEIEKAEAAYNEALAKLNKQKNTFVLQLQNSINALNIYKDTVNNAQSILDSQEQVYSNEQKRYDAGLSSLDNLLQQDTAWLEAKMTYYQIFETYLHYVMEYKYYTSGLVTVDVNAESLYSLNNEAGEGSDNE